MMPGSICLPAGAGAPVTPARDGEAAYHAVAAEWRAAWEGRGNSPIVTCRWPSQDDMLAWYGGYIAAVERGRQAWAAERAGEGLAWAA